MIWGLDTATRLTGWTAGTGEIKPETGYWEYDYVGSDIGWLLEDFDKDLCRLADRLPPTAIIFEAPIKMQQWDRTIVVRKLYAMAAYIELWGRKRGVLVQEENAKALKIRLTGSSKAEKADMVRMAEKVGIALPNGEGRKDAADSFAAWLVGVQHHAKQYLERWDQALYSPRGFLL